MKDNHHAVGIGGQFVFFIEGSPYMFTTDAITTRTPSNATGKAGVTTEDDSAKEIKEVDPDRLDHDLYVPWYNDNQFPHALLDKLGKLTVARRALTNNADMHMGSGVMWVRDDYTTSPGKVIYQPESIPDWNRLVRQGKIMLELSDLTDNLETLYLGFTQLIFDKNRTRINRTKTLKTCYCRYQPMDAQGNIPGIIYSAKFPDDPATGEYSKLPIFDPSDPYKYPTCVYVSSYGSLDKIYYPTPDYYSVIENGWANVAISVPKIINSIYKNAITIKWHIHIPVSYFVRKYRDWDSKTEAEQIAIFKTEQTNIESFLSGEENSGKAFISLVGQEGAENDGWKFEPMKSYLETTRELPNTTAADKQLLYAFSIDPGTFGVSEQGTSNLGGSGSGIRNGVQYKQSMLTRERWVTLDLLQTIAMVNGYPDDVYPVYKSTDMSQTLDANPTGSQTVIANT